MADIIYWGAYSPKLGQRLFEVNPDHKKLTDPKLAKMLSEDFANKLNRNKHMHTTDWTPITETKSPLSA